MGNVQLIVGGVIANISGAQAARYRDRRILLAGDAAHQFPATGIGINVGMLDAANLGWKLAAEIRGAAPPGLLDTYHAERHAAGARALLQTQAQVALRRGQDPAADALREVFSEVMRDEQSVRRIGAMIAGTDIRYPMPYSNDHALTGTFAPDLTLLTDRRREQSCGPVARGTTGAARPRRPFGSATHRPGVAAQRRDPYRQDRSSTGRCTSDPPGRAHRLGSEGRRPNRPRLDFVATSPGQLVRRTADDRGDVRMNCSADLNERHRFRFRPSGCVGTRKGKSSNLRLFCDVMGYATVGGVASGSFGRALTAFVGRRNEMRRLDGLLHRHRLVTITGPGGVGKTRLAAEVTRQTDDRFADGVRPVELAATHEPAQVPWVVATVLGAQERPGLSITQSIAAALAGAPSLLVLDNCEHLINAVAEFCAALLEANDDIRILATSREPIGVAGEALLRLTPFMTQHPDPSGPGMADAVTLFVDRARLRDPTFELTEGTASLVAEIVARVDGLPLAIELAAARVESLGLTQLLERLEEPLRLLTSGARTAARRHQSLRATADWSYQLTGEQSRRVFRRLAILPGPFTLDTAEAVAAPDAGPAVLSLVDASMLTPPTDGADGRARYLMLDSLRAFGREQLDRSSEREDALSAMTAHALRLAENATATMQSAGGEAGAAALFDAETGLLHNAFAWALEHDHTTALRLGLALAPWWQLRGRQSDGYHLLSRAVAKSNEQDASWRAAQKWLGRLAQSTAAWQAALAHFTILRDAVEPGPPSAELVDALVGRSGSLRNLGRTQDATDDACRGLELARTLAYVEGEALALCQLSLAATYVEDAKAAAQWAQRLRTIDPTRLPDKVARRIAVVDTIVLTEIGDLVGARLACTSGLASARAAGDVAGQADFLYFTTHIALRAGQLSDAGSHIRESLRLTALSGDQLRVLDCVDDCAHLCVAAGQWADALSLWAARSAHGTRLAMPDQPQDLRRRNAGVEQARQRLGSAAVRNAELRGSLMTLDTAAEFAAIAASSRSPTAEGRSAGVRLTVREKELITLVAQGHTDGQIADALFISIRTVRSHLDRIRDKSGSRRRADLTRLALQCGLV